MLDKPDADNHTFTRHAMVQVRHFYYRMVKRVVKLIGPGFKLNPSNSKEANQVLLKW